jgi:uncharacterized protein with HEPN domain
MRRFAGLRNLLVHRYWEVDNARLYRELKEEGLKTLRASCGMSIKWFELGPEEREEATKKLAEALRREE